MQSAHLLQLLNNVAYVLNTDQDGVILDANPRLADRFGKDIFELVGKTIRDLQSGNHEKKTCKAMVEGSTQKGEV